MQKTGYMFISVSPREASQEPWRNATFVKEVIIPELLLFYEHLNIVIADTLQVYNIQDWGPFPQCSEIFTGSLFEQPTIVDSLKLAREKTIVRGKEIEDDLNQFLDKHPAFARSITISHWADKVIRESFNSLKFEINNSSTEELQKLEKCINDNAHVQLEIVSKKYATLSDEEKALILEGSRLYLLEEFVYFKNLLSEGVEDVWYPGNFQKWHPLLLACEKDGRQRFHRLDTKDPRIAKLSIQRIINLLRVKNTPEQSEPEKILSKIKKVNSALYHLQDVLTKLIDEGDHRFNQMDFNSLDNLCDKMHKQATRQIITLRPKNKTVHKSQSQPEQPQTIEPATLKILEQQLDGVVE